MHRAVISCGYLPLLKQCSGASRPAIEDGALPGLQQSLVNRGAAYVKGGIEKWKGEAAKQLGVEGVWPRVSVSKV